MAWVLYSSFRFIRILFWSAACRHEMNFTVLDVVGQSDFGDLQSLSLFDHGFIQVIHFFHLLEVAGQHVEDVLKFLFVVFE